MEEEAKEKDQNTEEVEETEDTEETEEQPEVQESAISSGNFIGNAVKKGWASIPPHIKLYILLGIGGFALLIILAGAMASLLPNIFLDYSNDVSGTYEIEENYNEQWGNFCSEDNDGCSEEQKAAAEELRKSQDKFYRKFDKLTNKYLKNSGDVTIKKQKYIILTTIFYDYDIDDFTEGNLAYQIDETDEINYEVNSASNIYEKETDSLKELIKQFKVKAAVCVFPTDEEGKKTHPDYTLKDEEDEYYIFNFFDEFMYKVLQWRPDEYFKGLESGCKSSGGKVSILESNNAAASEGFYKYLRETTYFDEKPHLLYHFTSYGKNNGLSNDLSTWPEEDLIAVRERIIEDIQNIVDSYEEESEDGDYIASSGSKYWWPTGAVVEPGENGKEFSPEIPPAYLLRPRSMNTFGPRLHPILGYVRNHNGSDLPGSLNTTYAVASMGGTVTAVLTGCVSGGNTGCGGGWGNRVEITDANGVVTLYAHLHQNTIRVEVGDKVSQGEVIAMVGSSGMSTGAHLHFEVRVNGVPVDPYDYINPDDPRPQDTSDGSGDFVDDSGISFFKTNLTKTEFISKMNSYYSKVNCNNSGCRSFKSDILNHNGAEIIYDVGVSKGINPEILVERSIREGYGPGQCYNYFGYAHYNLNPTTHCFSSFRASAEAFFDNAKQYDNLYDMMYKWAYLGDYWYSDVGDWNLGGCILKDFTYPNGAPARVQNACSVSCSKSGGGACVATTEEDQSNYAKANVNAMYEAREWVFG